MRLIALLVLLAACEPAPPDPYNTEVPAPLGLERAAGIVRSQWGARLDVELPDVPEIRYYLGCLIYPDEYMRQEWYAGCIGGRYFGSGPIAHVKQDGGPGEDALAHELLHWALDMATGDGNGEHDNPLWHEVADVDAVLTLDALCLAKYDLFTCDELLRRNVPTPTEAGTVVR